MPIKATEVQEAIIAQFLADTDIASEFTGKVSKGLGRNFNFNTDGQGIRVYLAGDSQEIKELPGANKRVQYDYLAIVLFYETDEELAEERKAKYSAWVRAAIEADLGLGLGDTVMNTAIESTQFSEDPRIEGIHYLIIPLIVFTYEATA